MSADLFAEFGTGISPNQTSETISQRPTRHQSTSLVPDLDFFDDTPSSPFSNQAGQSAAAGSQWQSPSWSMSPVPGLAQQYSVNDVLFDATLETSSYDETEDWGEFETADVSNQRAPVEEQRIKASVSASRPTKAQEAFDLLDSLSLDDKPSAPGKPTGATQPKVNTQKLHKVSPSAIPSLPIEDDDPFEEWGDFVDGPATNQSQRQDLKAPVSSTQSRSVPGRPKVLPATTSTAHTSANFTASSPAVAAEQVRPINIPPPSVLLELFPQLFEQLRLEAMDARKDMQHSDKVERAAWVIRNTLKTAARVVAGRTLRWKRDKILSQSMRIGPAGKPGGMKLNAVNKNEDVKEQQEAVDVLTMWRDRAALYNSVIQASGNRPVPIIQENARAMTLSADRGAHKSSHACALCGLKRDERLPKVDENVEDSFGEWWTEHWGHTDCRQFWENNKALLGQR
ncbi:uncharacterized protein BP01DRAFT_360818 [Aspergillus saccharolyticus JOP 1030-1]|uniref:Serine/threonine-protein kinase ppk6 n=1 Tax=Aspergillus saccharolyticus JOP 1030-1 TaxID=1450539 RepID=A0A318ZBU8_9EURO|nr:hypothetical protein BP01DRAFT_360818 [Aspergillus saccharolyticus JOP 1030-1]PYH40950.1 hypothetical protein BP01DRAFT_360818 [Aspergillus saccharolyticus JOP 1030-1]